MTKFKQQLVQRVKIEEETEAEQQHLKEKYGISTEKDIMIVEKNNLIKFILRIFIKGIKISANIIIFFLSVVGLASLIYPDTRIFLFQQLMEVYDQICNYISFF